MHNAINYKPFLSFLLNNPSTHNELKIKIFKFISLHSIYTYMYKIYKVVTCLISQVVITSAPGNVHSVTQRVSQYQVVCLFSEKVKVKVCYIQWRKKKIFGRLNNFGAQLVLSYLFPSILFVVCFRIFFCDFPLYIVTFKWYILSCY